MQNIIIVVAYDLGCGIDSTTDINIAYDLYIKCYDKQRTDTSFTTFETRFTALVAASPSIIYSITPMMDVPYRQHIRKLSAPKQLGSSNCQVQICSDHSHIKNLTQVYKSVDLRESQLITGAQAQGGCGMCWAFGTTAMLENLILLDRASLNAFWQEQAKNLNLSVMFIGTNVYGGSDFCNGGNFYHAAQYIGATFQTIELAVNYPYTSAEVTAKQQVHSGFQSLVPKLHPDQYYLPFLMVQQESPLVRIFYSTSKYFDATARATMKSFLSRGIAVVGGMNVGGDSLFSSYNGRSFLPKKPCPTYAADHQVVFVGYGRKDGVDVWVMKNSWGASWGANGFFYVPMGSNDWCVEWEAFTLLPKHYVDNQVAYANIGNHARGNKNQLDPDSNEMVENTGAVDNPPPDPVEGAEYWWIWVVLGSMCLTVIVAIIIVWKCKRSPKTQRQQMEEIHMFDQNSRVLV